jgi:hypothetical protein
MGDLLRPSLAAPSEVRLWDAEGCLGYLPSNEPLMFNQ